MIKLTITRSFNGVEQSDAIVIDDLRTQADVLLAILELAPDLETEPGTVHTISIEAQ